MKLYVIRHGETEMGKNEIIATEDEPLNKFGMNQAQKVGKELKKLDIDIIYCSPIERAKHTLKLFDMDKNIPVIIDERIKERNMGIYEKVPVVSSLEEPIKTIGLGSYMPVTSTAGLMLADYIIKKIIHI